ncbi:3-keto-5-aminohexanoate cleavage protein [Sinanaerobacter chloroacetimidivorans]|jgi:3-keto-5-aminohexanoate cleavage enzyme|uniref:3-keto-5-aminohexanoate cleavage protein n=1 Tax=Sinanaerobacter chloroacetimidivorans TaxID=2818044 RepID=A0A8J8B3E1_9FIRM|nr:3-keto-5-aminohexanoate cleavage protein [Sinanaerobacter chloroacetimidivorans]MBR0598225.1 3-keto-5-aminohexanoate cleavage protein [Sinanaerobacter chloroacetimidivorans]
MEKLIITAAISGAEVTKEMNPAVPYTIEEIAREAKSAYDAGASVIHLHVRWDNGTPTQDKGRFKEAFHAIHNVCPDVIILPSTGGAVGMTAEERLQPIDLKPEIATLDCGTCNFGGDDIFVNTENMNIAFAEKMLAMGVKPELEVFEKGMIDNALKLYKKGLLKAPLHFNIVLGVNGAMAATTRDLVYMAGSLPSDATWCATGIGRSEFELAAVAIVMGGNVRVGFEDNLYLEKGVLAKSNGELVTKVVKMANILKREIASPADARRILGL